MVIGYVVYCSILKRNFQIKNADKLFLEDGCWSVQGSIELLFSDSDKRSCPSDFNLLTGAPTPLRELTNKNSIHVHEHQKGGWGKIFHDNCSFTMDYVVMNIIKYI